MRRWLGSSFGAALLLLVGGVLYYVLPEQPLWTLCVDEQVVGLTNHGAQFITFASTATGGPPESFLGPVRLRDCHTGALIDEFLPDHVNFYRCVFSRDGRHLAALTASAEFHVVDFHERRTWSFMLEELARDWDLQFDPNGRVLQADAIPNRNLVFELPSGKRLPVPDRVKAASVEVSARYLAYVRDGRQYLWDFHAQTELGPYDWDSVVAFSPDGGRALAHPHADDQEQHRLELWDLEYHRKLAALDPAERTPRIVYETRWSPDSRFVAIWPEFLRGHNQQVFEVWDSTTGERIGRHALRRRFGRTTVAFAPDLKCIALAEWSSVLEQDMFPDNAENGQWTLTLLDLPSARVHWVREFAHTQAGAARSIVSPRFSPDGAMLSVYVLPDGRWEFLDPCTGDTMTIVRICDVPQQRRATAYDNASPDGRWLLGQTELLRDGDNFWHEWAPRWLAAPDRRTLTVIVDSTTATETLRLNTPGRTYAHLALDGRLLVTDTPVLDHDPPYSRLQAWPVPLSRPWGWIVGVPLALATGWIGVARVWRWRRALRAAKAKERLGKLAP